MSSENKRHPFEALLVRLLENDITDREIESLNQWISDDPKSIEKYCSFLEDYAIIQTLVAGEIDRENNDLDDAGFDKAMWNALLEFEKTAPEIEVASPQKEPKVAVVKEMLKVQSTRSKVNKFQLYTLILSVAAIFFLVLYLRLTPPNTHMEVATLSDMIDVKWADSTVSLQKGDRLFTNHEPLGLSKGFIKIETDRGVTLTIEGPAEFEIIKEADLYLSYGRMYAQVTPQGIGFTVSTANSKVIDLGTEFGIKADFDETELHVMRGKTVLISGDPKSSKKQYEINMGQAKVVAGDGAVHDIALKKEGFVRQFDSCTRFIWRGQKLNLADIVGGGNGLGDGKVDRGIDYEGQTCLLEPFTKGLNRPEYSQKDLPAT